MPISYEVDESCQCETCRTKYEICKKPEICENKHEKCKKCNCCKKQKKHKKHKKCSDSDSDNECNTICTKPNTTVCKQSECKQSECKQGDCKQNDCKNNNYVVITINSFTPITEPKCCK